MIASNMLDMILLLERWLHSRQTHQHPNDPAFNKAYQQEEKLADEIRFMGQTLTATEAKHLMVDLEQMQQFIQDGEPQRNERDKLMRAALDDAGPDESVHSTLF